VEFIDDIFEIHYLWSLKNHLFGCYYNDEKSNALKITRTYINELDFLIIGLSEPRKTRFIKMLSKQFNDEWKNNKENEFVLFATPFIRECKCFIEELFNELSSLESITTHTTQIEQSSTNEFILDKFEAIHGKGWGYIFRTKDDCILFCDILTKFFEHKDYNLPETPIEVNNRCKTRFGKVLGEIHRHLIKRPLRSDQEYFNIVRCVNCFKNEIDLYKVLTR